MKGKMCPHSGKPCHRENCAFWAGSTDYEGTKLEGCVDMIEAQIIRKNIDELVEYIKESAYERTLRKRFKTADGKEVG